MQALLLEIPSGTTIKLGCFTKIFLPVKSEMALRKSTSLMEGEVGENPNPFSKTFISNGDRVFRFKLKT